MHIVQFNWTDILETYLSPPCLFQLEYCLASSFFYIYSRCASPTLILILKTKSLLICRLVHSLALSNTDILKEDTMNFERMAGPFPIPTAPTRTAGGTAGIPSSRINSVSVAVWKPLVSPSQITGSTVVACLAIAKTQHGFHGHLMHMVVLCEVNCDKCFLSVERVVQDQRGAGVGRRSKTVKYLYVHIYTYYVLPIS